MSDQILKEFGRQAAVMATAPAFNEERTLSLITDAMGPPPVDRVLEVACGPGIVAQAIAPFATELHCIDATPEMILLAKERLARAGKGHVTFHEAFAEDLPFGDDAFDVVVTRLSFHHFADLQKVLAEFHRVLRPQGRLVVADIISSKDPEESHLHNALEQLRDPTHVAMLSRQAFHIALRQGGFKSLFEHTWEQQRSFSEWAKIISMPGRTEPLREVMRSLSRAGIRAGVNLHEDGDELLFTHTWLLVAAEALTSTD
jgi:ubiquinone/menaquinone biosynthesis C-methylase UbiE